MARSKKTQAALDVAGAIKMAPQNAGIGVDIVDIARMEAILKRTPTFTDKYFTDCERNYCMGRRRPAEHFAARFAAKEAVAKALGCGFAGGVRPRDIEVLREADGRPEIALHGAAANAASEAGILDVEISLSHTSEQAVAFAMAIAEGARAVAEVESAPTTEQEIASRFKEARGMLDEL